MKTFLQPLTPKEEQIYLQKYHEGDLSAKDVLIERNLRLVAHIVKKYQGLDEDLDDLISIGTIGLMKAVATFDCQKGNRLATYAAKCIDNELLMLLRTKKKSSREISLYEPIGTDKEGNEISLIDIMEGSNQDMSESVIQKEEILLLYKCMKNTLTPREQTILQMRYGLLQTQEFTQREIAKRLNISRSYVSRIEKNALQKLRLALFFSP